MNLCTLRLYVAAHAFGDEGVGSNLSRLTHSKAVKESVNGSKQMSINEFCGVKWCI